MAELLITFKPMGIILKGITMRVIEKAIRYVVLSLLCGLHLISAAEQSGEVAKQNTSADNLVVVLRESVGENKQDEVLRPMGKMKAKLQDGKEIEIDTGWFYFLGDMHIRFVFDGPQVMSGAAPADLARLNLTPEDAVRLGVANIKRVYGKPTATSLSAGLMQVQGKSPDLDSSYFLDREFWQEALKKYPEGIVVSVAKRGGLIFVPLSDVKAVDNLRKKVSFLHSSSDRLRISSALYLFKDNHWTIFQPAGTR
jgi:hypothetical protein